jgi:hypothetical protein
MIYEKITNKQTNETNNRINPLFRFLDFEKITNTDFLTYSENQNRIIEKLSYSETNEFLSFLVNTNDYNKKQSDKVDKFYDAIKRLCELQNIRMFTKQTIYNGKSNLVKLKIDYLINELIRNHKLYKFTYANRTMVKTRPRQILYDQKGNNEKLPNEITSDIYHKANHRITSVKNLIAFFDVHHVEINQKSKIINQLDEKDLIANMVIKYKDTRVNTINPIYESSLCVICGNTLQNTVDCRHGQHKDIDKCLTLL